MEPLHRAPVRISLRSVPLLVVVDNAGLMQIDENVIKELKIKHTSSSPIAEAILLYGPIADVPLCYFDHICLQVFRLMYLVAMST